MPTCRQGAGLPFGRGHSRGRGGGRRPAAAAPRRHCAALAAVGNTHKRALSSEEEEDTWPSTSGEQQPPRVLPPPPSLRGRLPRKHWNALALAYLGDSVWEMYVRRHYFSPPKAMAAYYASVKASVRAEAQDAVYRRLQAAAFLTPEEMELLRWGRNATGTVPKRFAGAEVNTQTYRHATAVECLAGFLYLTDPQRLHALMAFLDLDGEALTQATASWDGSSGSSID